MDLTVTSLPAVCDRESEEGGLDLGSESLGDSGHWHLSDGFPVWWLDETQAHKHA